MQNKTNKKGMMQGFELGSFGLKYFRFEIFRKHSGNFPKRFFPEQFATIILSADSFHSFSTVIIEYIKVESFLGPFRFKGYLFPSRFKKGLLTTKYII
jgi:hypothetical protein